MSRIKELFLTGITLASLSVGCGSKDESSKSSTIAGLESTPNGYTLSPMTGKNVLKLTVNGSNCSQNSYVNKPCVAVQVCQPGTSNCQTINDILLDTGSFGLRLFSQAITPGILSTLTAVTNGSGNQIAECVQYGDGSKDWGPIKKADVILGEEPAVQVPIQVIDATYVGASTHCSGAETSPSSAGFNGILGVGVFAQDCGNTCASHASNGLYFACTGSSCSATTVSLVNQVQNPISALPTDNNGCIVRLPRIPLGGQQSVDGYFILGIDTASNNKPGSVTTILADPNSGDFTTTYNGQTYSSFLDTGSNGLFFPGSLPDCGPGLAGWFCPSSTQTLSATNFAHTGSASTKIDFQIGNVRTFNSVNDVFVEIGGNSGGSIFDWGLPFHLGRNIYVGIEGTTSSLSSGPYWAY